MRRFVLALLAVAALPALGSVVRAEPAAPPKLEFLYLEFTGVTKDEVAAVAGALGAVAGVQSFTWTAEAAEAKVVREVGKAAEVDLLSRAKAAGADTAGVVPIAVTTYTFEKKLHC